MLEIFDDGPEVGSLSLRNSSERFGLKQLCAGDDGIVALDDQQRFERIDVVGKGIEWRDHRS